MKRRIGKILAVTIAVVLLFLPGWLFFTYILNPGGYTGTLYFVEDRWVTSIKFDNWWFTGEVNIVYNDDQIAEILKVLNGFRYTEKIDEPWLTLTEPTAAREYVNRNNSLAISTNGETYQIGCSIEDSAIEYMGSRYIAAEEGYFSDFIDKWFPEVPIDQYDEPQILFSYDPAEVEIIEFLNGNSGDTNEIIDSEQITEIVEKLNSFRYTESTNAPRMMSGFSCLSIHEAGSNSTPLLKMYDSYVEIDGKDYYSLEKGFFTEFIELCPD